MSAAECARILGDTFTQLHGVHIPETHQDESFFRPEVLLPSQLVYLGPLGRQEELFEGVLYNFVFEGKQILFLEKRFPKCTLFCKSIEYYQQWLFSNQHLVVCDRL
jgi:hypothetical protein